MFQLGAVHSLFVELRRNTAGRLNEKGDRDETSKSRNANKFLVGKSETESKRGRMCELCRDGSA
jgi:hypothetical protein